VKGLQELFKKASDKEDARVSGASYETRSNFLRVMNQTGYNMYAGTVAHEEIKQRRARNKRARAARRINRVRGA
jgi:hypothetical protein